MTSTNRLKKFQRKRPVGILLVDGRAVASRVGLDDRVAVDARRWLRPVDCEAGITRFGLTPHEFGSTQSDSTAAAL